MAADKSGLSIITASQEDVETIINVVQETINKIYPHFYPKGAVEFFLSLHNETAIKEDVQNKKSM